MPVTHLDPAVQGNSSFGQILMIGLWEGLVVIDADDPSQVLPGAAESWDISDDGLTYTFHLRDNTRWSNGDPVTAGDFEWNWKRILTPGVAGEGSPSFKPTTLSVVGAEAYSTGESEDFSAVGARAVDDATFEITLETPDPDAVLKLAQYLGLPLHPATAEELGEAWLDPQNWVSNGAYILDDFRVNQGAVLLPNEHYWDADNYHLDRWEISFNDGGTTADLLSYQQGEIDITGRIEDDLEAVTSSDVADELVSSPTNQVRQLVVMNSHNPALHDVRVRHALAISIDREALGELATPAVAGPSRVPEAVPGYDEDAQIPFDPDQAATLLEEAGYPGGEGMPTVTLLDFQNSPWVEAIAQMWRDNLGINAELDIVEIGVYGDKREQVHNENYTGFWVIMSRSIRRACWHSQRAIYPPTRTSMEQTSRRRTSPKRCFEHAQTARPAQKYKRYWTEIATRRSKTRLSSPALRPRKRIQIPNTSYWSRRQVRGTKRTPTSPSCGAATTSSSSRECKTCSRGSTAPSSPLKVSTSRTRTS
ncbi:peptide ABC transporter substrate-binding protein [Phytoactinopolyspora endophytica]|uniref:peptide ABC transporter substrate-binding protein n=1 Tax=Phytoactinopolyspora endophytica TaxID=1642495 RepID=UPI0013EE3017|nr:peptide ABC transporter substrate-binding protein [Phytoactinopolyspora endophytica]